MDLPPPLPTAAQRPLSPPVRWLLIAAGWLSLVLGLIGILLPVLPTTPFVLLAFLLAACCTPCVHAWSVTIEDNTTALDFLNYTA